MVPVFIDTHAHLQDPRFAADRDEVLRRARAAGVSQVINVGYDIPSSRLAIELADKHQDLWAAVGIHPHDAAEADDEAIAQLRQMAGSDRVVAIGETGLDFYRDLAPRQLQRRLFRSLIHLAGEMDKPLIIHNREADEEVLAILAEEAADDLIVIMHCFCGGPDFARECLSRGYYLGIGGTVTYPKSGRLRAAVAQADVQQLILETDCPYLPPQGRRGQRNEPANLSIIAAQVAAVRGVSVQELATVTTANAIKLFGLDRLQQ